MVVSDKNKVEEGNFDAHLPVPAKPPRVQKGRGTMSSNTSYNTGDCSWGHLADTEHFGRKSASSDYVTVKFDEINQPEYNSCTQAGHCMIYSKLSEKVFGIYDPRASVLMQMRFDGYIGFPGGLIDEGESIVSGINRELIEEVNIDTSKMQVEQEHHIVTHWNARERLFLHFYALEVSLKDFQQIEKNALSAHDYGTEVMGIVRVPLYTMGDGYRGFPAFLTNSFVGNSREQLLCSLLRREIMREEEIERALKAKPM